MHSHIKKVFYEPDVTEEAFTFIVQYCHVSKKHIQVKLQTFIKLQIRNVWDILYAGKKYLMSVSHF